MGKKKYKWYKWLLNPVGTAVRKLTDDKTVLSKLTNPIDALVQLQSGNEVSGLDEAISDATKNLGETLEETKNNIKNYFTEGEGADAISQVWNAVTGERDTQENAKNRQFQHDEAEIARQWEDEQAKAAREWDSIGAQMERAAAAGVNPISIAMQNGGINSSATTSIPSAPGLPAGSSGLMHNGALDIANMIFQGIGTLAENRLKQTQSDDIVVMRQYNVAEKIANTYHLKKLCAGVELSNVAQQIQNRWLDKLNQANYDNMLLSQGVSRATIREKNSVSYLNIAKTDEIRQNMRLNLERFNATLPLELQLMESELNNKNMSTQAIYEEICLRHLQQIEQQSRNVQADAEAESAQTAADLAKATFEDAINAFHNDMLKGAAEAGVSLNDYQYYSIISHSPTEAACKAGLQLRELNHKRKNFVRRLIGKSEIPYYDTNGFSNELLRGLP